MIRLLEIFFPTSNYGNPMQRERARIVTGITLLMLVLYTLYALFASVDRGATTPLFERAFQNPFTGFVLTSFFLIGIATLYAVREGFLNVAGYGPLAMWYLGGVLLGYESYFVLASDSLTLALLILLGALLNGERGLVVSASAALITLTIGVSQRTTETPAVNINEYLTLLFMLGGSSFFLYLFMRATQTARAEQQSEAAEERLTLAQLTTQIARRISSRMALEDVLNNAIEQITERYPKIYHAQIFLVDDAMAEARLAASTGIVGRMLLQRKHSLPVGSQSVIGRVTSQGEPVIARAGANDSVHKRNEFLPDTVVEAAFPLRIGDKIIGALDMQSREIDAFQPNDTPIFQSLADSIAVAIDNARLFEETEAQLAENSRLVERTREAMQQVERLNQQLTERVWEQYLRGKGDTTAMSVDFASNNAQPDEMWTPALSEAIRNNHVVQNREPTGQTIAVPLRVHGQVIGAMEFELGDDGALSPEELGLIQQVGERFGMAVENARLYEESQRVAQREALVNEISARLQSTNNVEAVLAEAARSLQQSLNAGKVSIRLGTPPAQNKRRNGAR